MITIKWTASGYAYRMGDLRPGHGQYIDRLYQFAHVPEDLYGCPHIMTRGDDKMLPEDQPCFSIETDGPCEVYVLYPDKQPVLPGWLEAYQRVRKNVTRMDSHPDTLKGYFSLYRRSFQAGEIRFYGSSPLAMLAEDWYVETTGTNYCMYSVCVRESRTAAM